MRFKLRPTDSASGMQIPSKHMHIFHHWSLSFAFLLPMVSQTSNWWYNQVSLVSVMHNWLIPAQNYALCFKGVFFVLLLLLFFLLLLLWLLLIFFCLSFLCWMLLPSPFISHSAYSVLHLLAYGISTFPCVNVPTFSVLSEGMWPQWHSLPCWVGRL